MRTLKIHLVLLCALFVSSCATTNAPTSRVGGQVISTDVPQATFKLSDYRVQWESAAALQTELRCAINAGTLERFCSSSPAAKTRSDQDVALMNQLLQTHAPNQVNALLNKRGLREGATTVIELKPQSGYWSESGWGSGVLVQVLITNSATGQKWAHTLPADTGVQLLGAMFAGVQTLEFATAFASRLDSVLAQAGFYK